MVPNAPHKPDAFVIFSPLGLSQGFNGFCATPILRRIRIAQKPLNPRRKRLSGFQILRGNELRRLQRDSASDLLLICSFALRLIRAAIRFVRANQTERE